MSKVAAISHAQQVRAKTSKTIYCPMSTFPMLLALMILTAGCNKSNPSGTSAPTYAPQPATATKRDITGQVLLNGLLIVPPDARADLNPPFRATVNKVNRNVGVAVSKGDILVELAMPTAEAYHEQTKQALSEAQSAYANAKKEYKAPVDAAQKQLDAARAASKTNDAATSNGVTSPSGDETSANAPSDSSTLASDRVSADQALLQAKADMASQMLPYKQQVAQALAANQQARASEKQGYLRSPISGTLITLNAQPGKEVVPNVRTPVATVVNLNALQVQSAMTLQQGGYIKPRMRVTLTFDELPDKSFEGIVYRMTTQPRNMGFVAIINFTNEQRKVKPEMKPHIAIKTGKMVKDVVAVPSSAVHVDNTGKPMVNVMREGKWVATPVEAGISDSQFIEIKSGLKAGDTVQVTS